MKELAYDMNGEPTQKPLSETKESVRYYEEGGIDPNWAANTPEWFRQMVVEGYDKQEAYGVERRSWKTRTLNSLKRQVSGLLDRPLIRKIRQIR